MMLLHLIWDQSSSFCIWIYSLLILLGIQWCKRAAVMISQNDRAPTGPLSPEIARWWCWVRIKLVWQLPIHWFTFSHLPFYLQCLGTYCGFNSGLVLEKVAEYFYYNYRNRNREDVPDMEIPPELCLELLMAADFLDSMSSLSYRICTLTECFAAWKMRYGRQWRGR